jgi:hypothetical protein
MTDYNCLNGKELLQVCIGLFQVIMNFTDEVSITIECTMRLTNTDGLNTEISSDCPEQTRELICLLGHSVAVVDIKELESLTLLFSDGVKLSLVGNDQEESFTISTPIGEIVV